MNPTPRPLVKIATRIAVIVAVLGFAIAVFLVLKYTKPKAQMVDRGQALPRVAVLAAAKAPVQRQWEGYGSAEAIDSANVPARVTATVVHVPEGIEDGAPVTARQLLVRLDDSDFQRQSEIAEQNLAEIASQLALIEIEQGSLTQQLKLKTEDVTLARNEVEQVKSLRGSARTSRELDHAERALLAAQLTRLLTAEMIDKLAPRRQQIEAQRSRLQSSARLARQNLERCDIVSPLDGILQSVDAEVGENVVTGQRVARVVDLRRVELPLRLPASARADVAVGNSVVLSSTNQARTSWSARVSRIAPEDDASTRTVTVFVEVDQSEAVAKLTDNGNAAGLLAPGMFLSGVVTSDRVQDRWVVPRRAVRSGRVLVVEGKRIHSRQVQVDFLMEAEIPSFGLADNQWVVLDSDASELRDGDLVLVNASTSLLDGAEAEPVLQSESATASRLTGPASVKESSP